MSNKNRNGQALARLELQVKKAEAKARVVEARESGKVAREKAKGEVFAKKLQAKAIAEERARTKKFASQVESQNVRGIIPEVENRGVHNMVTSNPFSPPEKELERDKNGFLKVRNSVWM